MNTGTIGRGWAFPVHATAGGVALVSGEQEIEQSITLILGTALGERPMRPDFGCAIHDYVFAGADPRTIGRIVHEVRASLLRWEPRVEVSDVTVAPYPDDPTKLLIDVCYSIRPTNDPRNLVVPFYVIPVEDELVASGPEGE